MGFAALCPSYLLTNRVPDVAANHAVPREGAVSTNPFGEGRDPCQPRKKP
jgi:hypothetical protein